MKNFVRGCFLTTAFFFCGSSIEAKKEAATSPLKVSGVITNLTDFNDKAALLNGSARGAEGNLVDRLVSNQVRADFIFTAEDKDAGVKFETTVRGRFVAGASKILGTTSEKIKLYEALTAGHSHNIESHMIFVRKIFVEFTLDKVLGTNIGNQKVKIGAFPYSVGRGISLGAAFAISPASLGFYNDKTVNRYAYGLLFSGELFTPYLEYNLYGAILKNQATGLRDTGDQVFEQLIINGKYPTTYARGFGKINKLFAANLLFTPIKEDCRKIIFEPYFVINNDPAQKTEFSDDTKSSLKTFGGAIECEWNQFEIGFEGALNRGSQVVKPWDRNQVILTSRNGDFVEVYNNIYDQDPTLPGAQRVFYDRANPVPVPTGTISSALNGRQINATGFFNSANRYRDGYVTYYKGWFALMDASWYLYKRDFKVAVTGGITTGDALPREQSGAIRTYKGFVPLQELYSGKRVTSVFVMGPGSSLERPQEIEQTGQFATTVNDFSNLVFGGIGFTYQPQKREKLLKINPNLLMYWKHYRTHAYDIVNRRSYPDRYASNMLGVEINTFVTIQLNESTNLDINGSIFVPGQHYKDVKGTPLNQSQVDAITKAAVSGFEEDSLPTLGADRAFTFGAGVSYSF